MRFTTLVRFYASKSYFDIKDLQSHQERKVKVLSESDTLVLRPKIRATSVVAAYKVKPMYSV